MNAIDVLNQWSSAWMAFLWYRSIDVLLVFLVVGALWLIVRHKASAQFGYWLFLLVLLKLMVPSFVSLPQMLGLEFRQSGDISVSGSFFFGDWWGSMGTAEGGTSTSPKDSVPAPAVQGVEKQESAVSPLAVAMLVWAAIVALLFARFALHQWRICRKLRQTRPIILKTAPINLTRLQEIAKMKDRVRWVSADWTGSPLVWGIFRPTIVVPSNLFVELSPNQLRWVLLHELAHIRRHDNLVSLIQSLLQMIFFFHPAVWMANFLIDRQREYACDDEALAGSQISRRECGEGFLGVVFHADGALAYMPATLGLINYKTLIRRRLMRIIDKTHVLQTKITNLSKVFLFAFALLIVPFSWNVAVAQVGEWIMADTDPANSPPVRCMQLMVYDSVREVIVLHGGWREGELSDTWEFDVNTQTWEHVANDGPTCSFMGMAYDPVRQVTVLSGKLYGNCQTWEWDGLIWYQVDQEDYRLMAPAMVYHPERKTVIRHGGAIAWDDTVTPNTIQSTPKTMEWDGNQWSPLPDGPSLGDHQMVYDSVRNKLVVFGGFVETNVYSNETWEFDGVTWTKVADTGPEARQGFGMVFDSDRGVTVLLGGGLSTASGNESTIRYNDMWQWDGTEWTMINIEAPTEHNLWLRMVYYSKNNQIVMFGGAANNIYRPNDTWLFSFTQSGIPRSLWSMY